MCRHRDTSCIIIVDLVEGNLRQPQPNNERDQKKRPNPTEKAAKISMNNRCCRLTTDRASRLTLYLSGGEKATIDGDTDTDTCTSCRYRYRYILHKGQGSTVLPGTRTRQGVAATVKSSQWICKIRDKHSQFGGYLCCFRSHFCHLTPQPCCFHLLCYLQFNCSNFVSVASI